MLSALGLARDPARVGACNRETTPRDGVDVFSVNAPHSVRDGFEPRCHVTCPRSPHAASRIRLSMPP